MDLQDIKFEKLLDFTISKLLPALLIFIAGVIIITILIRLLDRGLTKSKRVDAMLNSFITNAVKIALWIVLILQVMGQLGIDSTSVLTIFAAAGAAVALALQGSLSNLASGIIIIVNKPFSHGDYIQGGGNEGTVDTIDLLYTTITTPDNKIVSIPNSALTSGNIINYYKGEERRLDVFIGISYESDLAKAKEVLINIAKGTGYYLDEKPITCDVKEYADSSINLRLRGWVKADKYWAANDAVNNNIKPEFDKNGIEIPYPQLDVHTK